MKRRVFWTESASRELNALLSRIAQDSPQNAGLVGARIDKAAARLAVLASGRIGRVQNTFEVVVRRTPYILVYEKADERIVVLHVIHGARDWRAGSWPPER